MNAENFPSLAEVITRVEADKSLGLQKRRTLASAIRRLCKAHNVSPAAVPATVEAVRDLTLHTRIPIHLLSNRSWRNVKSSVRAALRHLGILPTSSHSYKDLSPAWQLLRLKLEKVEYAKVSAFFHFCSGQSIEPDAVTQETFETYRQHLLGSTTGKDPEHLYALTVSGWNNHSKKQDGWPSLTVHRVSRSISFALPVSAFPESFQQALAAEKLRLKSEDLFDPAAPAKPLRESSIAGVEGKILRFSTAMIKAGRPSSELRSLTSLLDPEWFKNAISWYLKDRYQWNEGEPVPANVSDMASSLKRYGRYWLRAELKTLKLNDPTAPETAIDQQLEALGAIVKSLNARTNRSNTLTEKNRATLLQFDDPQTELALLTLPENLFAAAQTSPLTPRSAQLFQTGLIFAILLAAPIRYDNLRNLRFDRHLKKTGSNRNPTYCLFIPATEVKNRIDTNIPLPGDLVEAIDLYRSTYLSLLAPADTPFFFLGRDGDKPKSKTGFRGQFDKAVARYIGVDLTPHQMRHLAAKLILLNNPGNYALVQQLLHHSDLQTTVKYYASFDREAASRDYQKILEARGKPTSLKKKGKTK